MSTVSRKKPRLLAAFCLLSPLLLTACNSDRDDTTGDDTGSPTNPDTAAGTGATPGPVFRSAIGDVLTFGAANRTLHTFANDIDGTSNCNNGCAVTWPPVTASAADSGASGSFSTIPRQDGSLQWAINGRPLYYYLRDASEGEINGEGIGGVWYAARQDPVVAYTTSLGDTLVGRGTINNGAGDASSRSDRDGFSFYTFRNDNPGTSAILQQLTAIKLHQLTGNKS